MIDTHPESRHSRAKQIVLQFMEQSSFGGGVPCPLCQRLAQIRYHTELTARFQCTGEHKHSFSIAISELRKEVRGG